MKEFCIGLISENRVSCFVCWKACFDCFKGHLCAKTSQLLGFVGLDH